MALLSDAEVRQYHELGYLVPSFRLGRAAGRQPARGAGPADARQPRRAAGKAGQRAPVAQRRAGQRRRRARPGRVPGAGAPRADPRRGGTADRPGHHPVGLPRVLQAGRRRPRDAVAPGRPLLADPPAGHLHGVGGAGRVDHRERLPAGDPALAPGAHQPPAPARGPAGPGAAAAPARSELRCRHRGRPATAARADVDARRVHDPRRRRPTAPPSAAPAWRCATCRAARCSSATWTRWPAAPACQWPLPRGRCGCCAAATAPAATTSRSVSTGPAR